MDASSSFLVIASVVVTVWIGRAAAQRFLDQTEALTLGRIPQLAIMVAGKFVPKVERVTRVAEWKADARELHDATANPVSRLVKGLTFGLSLAGRAQLVVFELDEREVSGPVLAVANGIRNRPIQAGFMVVGLTAGMIWGWFVFQSDEVRPLLPESSVGTVAQPAYGLLTSGFGDRWGSLHTGIDIAAQIGKPIRAVAAGTVVDSGPASGFGMWVVVRHNEGTRTVYGHIDSSMVVIGEQVSAGDPIARVGSRGYSTGPHLHLEVWEADGTKVDPAVWLAQHGVKLVVSGISGEFNTPAHPDEAVVGPAPDWDLNGVEKVDAVEIPTPAMRALAAEMSVKAEHEAAQARDRIRAMSASTAERHAPLLPGWVTASALCPLLIALAHRERIATLVRRGRQRR